MSFDTQILTNGRGGEGRGGEMTLPYNWAYRRGNAHKRERVLVHAWCQTYWRHINEDHRKTLSVLIFEPQAGHTPRKEKRSAQAAQFWPTPYAAHEVT